MLSIEEARQCWERLADFRRKRNRCRDYTFGRQWNDVIEVDGRPMTEYEYIMREGNVPLKNNLIRRIVRNVLGVFRKQLSDIMADEYKLKGNEFSEVEKEAMESLVNDNSLEEIFSRSMEEFLISGMTVHRKRLSDCEPGPRVITEIVSPDSFFFNTDSRDVRGSDINLIGQFHKVNFNDWCKAFVKNKDDFKRAEYLFEGKRKINVAEIWRKETVPFQIFHDVEAGKIIRIDAEEKIEASLKNYPRKWLIDEVWKYYFISDDGRMLQSGESPYMDGGHPYVLKSYPYLDGEIHSFVADMIDQQRYTNRLITLYDWVIRASAKGVLLLPEGAVAGRDVRSMADQWGRFNGVIVYKAKPGEPEPRQVSGNMSNLGISELLEIQLKMMEDVSGVNGILQGNTSGGNVSGELYNSQTANAMYSLSDLLDTFRVFIHDSARKDLMLVRQMLQPSHI